jgi:rhodanese-related sulfurtransferase/catechol 2,3-dioxygenase-like lactoylglutathione lyase family enzyme
MLRPPIDGQITFLTVSDPTSSSRFYGELLGLDLVLDQGPCRIYRVTPSAYVGICTHRETVHSEGVIITIVTDQVDEWFTQLSEAGVLFESAPTRNNRFDIYHVLLRDPDGHLVEIQQFMDPIWAGRRTAEDLLVEARGKIRRWLPAEAQQAQHLGALIIDVRDSAHIAREGSIPGAIAVPLSVVEWRADPTSAHRLSDISDAEGPLILVCSDGYSSSLAAARLREIGRSEVGDVVGGFRAWKLEGLPVDH